MIKFRFDYRLLPHGTDAASTHCTLINLDLHSHSTFSDGTLTPRELVERATGRKVAVLALTDHDDTGGLAAARVAAQDCGLRLVDGVEISVTWCGKTIHVVGLGIDPCAADLQAGLAAIRRGRSTRAEKIVAAFDQLGIAGSREGAQEFAANPQLVSRTHFARFLVKRGVVKDMKSAFKRFLGGGQPCFVPHEWATLSDAVRWIKASGGLAVLAHPGRYQLDSAQMRRLLADFRDMGGAALEVVTSSHPAHEQAAFAQHARTFGLAASAGSDFHSPAESQFDLGGLPDLPAGCEPVWRAWGIA